jgi:hypothetical protein
VPLVQLQEAPEERLILVAGPPGVGESSFCRRAVLHSVAADQPVIPVTTDRGVPKATGQVGDVLSAWYFSSTAKRSCYVTSSTSMGCS